MTCFQPTTRRHPFALEHLKKPVLPEGVDLALDGVIERITPRMGSGPCSYPNCYGDGGFRACSGFQGTGNSCTNCTHSYSYHA